MAKSSLEKTLMEVSTPEERLDLIFSAFSLPAILSIIDKTLKSDKDLSEYWFSRTLSLAKAALSVFIEHRDSGVFDGTKKDFLGTLELNFAQQIVKDKSVATATLDMVSSYLEELPGYNKKTKKQEARTLEAHESLKAMLIHAVDVILKKLNGRDNHSGNTRSVRMGDVVAEGPGFEIVVGHKMQNVVRYSEGRTGIILMHDPRDGHFLMVERYSDVDGGYILEFPKALATSMHNKENAAAIALRDQTGLSLRTLEKIGEIRPDTHMIAGVCDVYYGTFDLEENYYANSKIIRDVKRMNEEGLYQAAYDNKVHCAQTLSAISIWHAFESVRKKRVANSRRIRTPKSADAIDLPDLPDAEDE
jgi:hypothetical protein